MKREWYNSAADYIHRCLGIAVLLVVLYVILARLPVEFSGNFLLPIAITLTMIGITISDAITPLISGDESAGAEKAFLIIAALFITMLLVTVEPIPSSVLGKLRE
jgi:hypothetical protein